MRKHSLIEFTLFALLLAGAETHAAAKEANTLRPLQIDDYFSLKNVGNPRVSPDGKWVAYTVMTRDLEKDNSETRVWMIPTSGGEAIPMTGKGNSAWQPRWSPDGKYLSFLSVREGGADSGAQVFTLDLRGGEGVQLTSVEPGVEGYEWSPNGKRLVLTIRDQDTSEAPGPWVVDRLQIKDDYVGYLNRLRSHLYIFDVDTRATVQITSGDYEDYAPAWSPDGSTIAFTSNRTVEPDDNFNTDIWLVKPDTPHDKQDPVRITSNPGSDENPLWHPDGKRIAYWTTIQYQYVNYAQTEVAIIRVGEDEPVVLSESLDRNIFDPFFAADGNSIYFLLEDDGRGPSWRRSDRRRNNKPADCRRAPCRRRRRGTKWQRCRSRQRFPDAERVVRPRCAQGRYARRYAALLMSTTNCSTRSSWWTRRRCVS